MTVAISASALCGAAPVAAHGATDTSGSRIYRSEITEPGAPGLSWQVIGGDAAVELENRTEREVTVVGYTGEPYLRFVPGDGVYRNPSSPATYLNEDRYGDAGIPLFATASAEPVWEQMANTNRHSWHDHRAHWMAGLDPPIVVGARDQEHIVVAIAIPLVIGDGPIAIDVTALGEVRWLPDLAWWPPIVILAGIFTALIAAIAATNRPHHGRWTPLARETALIVVMVIVANAVRTVDDIAARSTSTADGIVMAVIALAALGVVVALTTLAWSGRPSGFWALSVAALMLMLFYGGEASAELSAPQFATTLPEWVRRWTIAASYTVVAPAFLAAFLAGRWYARAAAPVATPGTWAPSEAVT